MRVRFILQVVGMLMICLTIVSCNNNKKTKNELIIFTYSSFQSSWGPAPLLKKEFEKQCECSVIFKNAGDAELILKRVRLNKDEPVDIVMGIDQFSLSEAEVNLSWEEIKQKKYPWHNQFPSTYLVSKHLYPFDWSPLAINTYDPSIQLSDFKDLAATKLKISLQDPRMSAPGLQFYFWLIDEMGLTKALSFYGSLVKNKARVLPSWSSAYGVFKKKQVQLTFSYLTSPLYHQIEENNNNYRSVIFKDKSIKYPVHVEYMGILKRSTNIKLAMQFVDFVLSSSGQKIIAEKNYMLPVRQNIKIHKAYASIIPKDVKFVRYAPINQETKTLYLKKWKDEVSKITN